VAATDSVTVPSPLPDDRPCRAIQSSLEVADQSHSRFVETVIASVPPADPIGAVVGCTLYAQPCDWVRVNGCPATIAVPVRALPVVAVAVKVTGPEPRPVGGFTVSQSALLDAVHGQRAVVVTAIVPPPPAGGTD